MAKTKRVLIWVDGDDSGGIIDPGVGAVDSFTINATDVSNFNAKWSGRTTFASLKEQTPAKLQFVFPSYERRAACAPFEGAAPAAPAPATCSDKDFEHDIDYFSMKKAKEPGTGPEDCCAKCSGTPHNIEPWWGGSVLVAAAPAFAPWPKWYSQGRTWSCHRRRMRMPRWDLATPTPLHA